MSNERDTARGAITFALWDKYGMALPESPWQMAEVIQEQLVKEGYLRGERDE